MNFRFTLTSLLSYPSKILTPWQNVMKCLSLITIVCLVWKITQKLLEAWKKKLKKIEKKLKKSRIFLKIVIIFGKNRTKSGNSRI